MYRYRAMRACLSALSGVKLARSEGRLEAIARVVQQVILTIAQFEFGPVAVVVVLIRRSYSEEVEVAFLSVSDLSLESIKIPVKL